VSVASPRAREVRWWFALEPWTGSSGRHRSGACEPPILYRRNCIVRVRVGSIERVTTMKRQRPVKLLPIVGVLATVMTSCASQPLGITPGQKPVRLLVSSGCRPVLSGSQDVVNSYTGDELVPANPVGGLICRYSPDRSLYAGVDLATSDAVRLAVVIDAISTAAPQGTFHCPASDDSASIIAFSYAGRADVDLWFSDSGCETLDNGRIRVYESGNPSFQAFLTQVSELAPGRNR
jgi:hypothetical protein